MSWQTHSTRSLRAPYVAALVAVLFIVLMSATRATAAEPLPTETHAHWSLESRTAPENLTPEAEGMIIATASNLGDAEINAGAGGSKVTITDTLPAGVTATSVEASSNSIGEENGGSLGRERKEQFTCPTAVVPGKPIECTFIGGRLSPYELLQLKIRVHVENGAQPGKNKVSVKGGGAPTEELERTVKVGGAATFGVESFEMKPENENFEPDEHAGSHPFQLTTTFDVNQSFELAELEIPQKLLPSVPALEKNLSFRLPPGLIGDVNAVKQCSGVEFGSQGEAKNNACPNETAVGVASVSVFDPTAHGEYYATYLVPVFNLEPAAGEPARFGFSVLHVPVVLDTSLRTGEDYGVTVSVHYASQTVQVLGSKVTFWGIPGDERHNSSRGWVCLRDVAKVEPQEPCGTPAKPSQPVEPLLMLPTKCGKLETSVEGEAWNGAPLVGLNREGEQTDRVPNEAPTVLKECGPPSLGFNPSIYVEPETHEASTPTGLNFTLTMPQTGTMEASYKNTPEAAIQTTKVALPVGLQTGAGAANGLTACPAASLGFNEPGNGNFQAGLDEAAQAENDDFSATLPAPTEALPEPPCLSTSKIGTVSIKTPVLERELTGGVYLSQQDTNPFASPLVLYIIATDKAPGEEDTSKVVVKLAGEVTIDPSTGQLVSYFKNTPQSPFETLTLHLWNGNRASQVTPAHCGTYPTKSLYTSSSQEVAPTEPEYEFQITSGPGGTPCPGATLPFQPGYQAESSNPNAGGYTPFKLGITVPDGDAALKTISMQLPPGLAAVLASVPLCPEPKAAEGTCEAESEIGQSVALSGLGGTPVRLPGEVYLTGPYNGAPFGLSSVTEAHAGPFELGRVVVRSGITVNPYTAAATITTENARFVPGELNASNEFTPVAPLEGEQTEFAGLPERLKGVPSQLKQLEVTVNRPGFEFNPTSCEKMSVAGTLTGYEGTSAGVSSPFQVGNCGALPFAPKLTAIRQRPRKQTRRRDVHRQGRIRRHRSGEHPQSRPDAARSPSLAPEHDRKSVPGSGLQRQPRELRRRLADRRRHRPHARVQEPAEGARVSRLSRRRGVPGRRVRAPGRRRHRDPRRQNRHQKRNHLLEVRNLAGRAVHELRIDLPGRPALGADDLRARKGRLQPVQERE